MVDYNIEEKNLEGFTMIEAVLVLAIGGLIFSLVFLALPGAFANARDGERRDDVLFTVNKLKNFQANNNRGALPTDTIPTGGLYINGSEVSFGPTSGVKWKDFYASFFDENYTDPRGTKYNWRVVNCGASGTGSTCTNAQLANFMSSTFEANNFTMFFVIGATCNGDTAVSTPNNRMVSVLYKLERAGTYCVNT